MASKIPVLQDVCIFCSTRMQIAASLTVLRSQRRTFRATCAVEKPLAAVLAYREDEEDQEKSGGDPPYNPSRRELNSTLLRKYRVPSRPVEHNSDRNAVQISAPPQVVKRSGWARASASSGLTPEELTLREALRKDFINESACFIPQEKSTFDGPPVKRYKRDSPGRSPVPRFITEGPHNQSQGHIAQNVPRLSPRQVDWDCPSCGIDNFGRNYTCRRCRCIRPTQDEKRQRQWVCTSCEQMNTERHQRCWDCRSERTPGQQVDDMSLVEGWKHVRPPARVPSNQFAPRDRHLQAGVLPDHQNDIGVRNIEQERLMRMENTRDGRFVGLREQQDPTLGSSQGTTPEASLAPLPVGPSQSSFDPGFPDNTGPSPLSMSNHVPQQDNFRLEPQRGRQQDWRQHRESHLLSERENESDILSIARGFDRTSIPFSRGENRYKDRRRSRQAVSSHEEADEDDEDRAMRAMERKQRRKKEKEARKAAAPPTRLYLPEFISVSNLAGVLRVRVEDFVSKMRELGFEEMNNDHVLDGETAGLVAAEFNFEPIVEHIEDRDLHALPMPEDKSSLPARPPVVTIMGHVDHGKTTLLDYLRKSSVAATEHGGITQHIGAFSVPMSGGRLVTFLDTPGHEAFLSMRQRGANVTDIVILVVAADDSVKPQTIEAIKHAHNAKVPLIVAVNKIDKDESNVERVKQDLARYGVEIEDYGGETQIVCVSGKTGQGMEELEDAVVALADILDMRAEVNSQAEGWVLEAATRKAGRVATVLIRRGTLKPGDIIVAGTSWARIRSLRNEAGTELPFAGPGTPVAIDGWREQPAAGDEVIQALDEQTAKSVVEYRLEVFERTKMATDMEAVNEVRRLEQEKREQLDKAAEVAATNADDHNSLQGSKNHQRREASTGPAFQEVFFVVKGDVSGSVEAVTDSVSSLGNSEVRPHILRSGVGPVTEFDIDHAAVAKGHIINFNTIVDGNIRQMAEEKDVEIIDHSIIYKLVDDIKAKLGEKLPPSVTQKVLGEAEIGQVFDINIKRRVTVPIAGCRVRNGVINRGAKIRVLRGRDVIYEGTLSSLKNVKKDITDVRKGTECGMGFENWTDFKVGDQVQAFEEVVEKRTL